MQQKKQQKKVAENVVENVAEKGAENVAANVAEKVAEIFLHEYEFLQCKFMTKIMMIMMQLVSSFILLIESNKPWTYFDFVILCSCITATTSQNCHCVQTSKNKGFFCVRIP